MSTWARPGPGTVRPRPTTQRSRTVSVAAEILNRLDSWVNELAAHLDPPRRLPESDGSFRLEFTQQSPSTVMVGKLVRAVSGLHGALVLAKAGYITECAVVLRTVSDFSTEIQMIGWFMAQDEQLPCAVQDFVEEYFLPRARTSEEFAAAGRKGYVSREKLMKEYKKFAESVGAESVNAQQLDLNHRFVNMSYDAYVHGAYETALELWSDQRGTFMVRSHASAAKRDEFIEAVFMKMREVVVAMELTATALGNTAVFEQARKARHTMNATEPWRLV